MANKSPSHQQGERGFQYSGHQVIRLLTDTQLSDQCAVTIEVLLLKVRKVTTTLAYETEQSLTAAVVFAVALEVVAQLLDTEREQGDLALS